VLEERADATVWCSEVEFTPGDWAKDAWPLRYLVLRIRKKQGHLFATGDETKYLAVVTNRDGAAPDLIRWHWQKAGTIELLATARGLEPETATTSLALELGLALAEDRELYQAMDWLVARQSRIEAKLAHQHLQDGSLILYDANAPVS
jgi:hypothetical protein